LRSENEIKAVRYNQYVFWNKTRTIPKKGNIYSGYIATWYILIKSVNIFGLSRIVWKKGCFIEKRLLDQKISKMNWLAECVLGCCVSELHEPLVWDHASIQRFLSGGAWHRPRAWRDVLLAASSSPPLRAVATGTPIKVIIFTILS